MEFGDVLKARILQERAIMAVRTSLVTLTLGQATKLLDADPTRLVAIFSANTSSFQLWVDNTVSGSQGGFAVAASSPYMVKWSDTGVLVQGQWWGFAGTGIGVKIIEVFITP
jgi:hypothetical protein